MISVLHIHPEFREIQNLVDYVIKNINYIDVIRINSITLMRELTAFVDQSDDYKDINDFIGKHFNNNYFKDNIPVPTPNIAAEIGSIFFDHGFPSFLVTAYHYSIPIFINDIYGLTGVMYSSVNTNAMLFSTDTDMDIYSGLYEIEDLINFAYIGSAGKLDWSDHLEFGGPIMFTTNMAIPVDNTNLLEKFITDKDYRSSPRYLYDEMVG